MFTKTSNNKKVDREIASALDKLVTLRENTEEYNSLVDRIAKLEKLKSDGLRPPSVDTMLIVGANIFGILWLARYEREHVIKSQSALKFVMRAS